MILSYINNNNNNNNNNNDDDDDDDDDNNNDLVKASWNSGKHKCMIINIEDTANQTKPQQIKSNFILFIILGRTLRAEKRVNKINPQMAVSPQFKASHIGGG